MNSLELYLTYLNEVKPSLIKHYRDAKYYLEVKCYPEIYEKEMTLIIKIDYSKEGMEKLNDRLLSVDLEINQYKIELGPLGKFFIITESV